MEDAASPSVPGQRARQAVPSSHYLITYHIPERSFSDFTFQASTSGRRPGDQGDPPFFESWSLKGVLHTFRNPLAHFLLRTPRWLPNLKTFGASECDIPEIYPGVFDHQVSLRNVYLQENRLTTIPSGAFRTTGNTIFHIVLDDNLIVEVAEGAFPDMKEHTSIYLYNNRIRLLDEAVWRPLLENDVTVWLSGNPLTCGCDAAWAVLNSSLLQQLPNAHCESGVDLAELDPGIFESC
nr:oplophorus-luciferin 2-monooxygenase non-catalytic subunit-like [Penaeus vannamei]